MAVGRRTLSTPLKDHPQNVMKPVAFAQIFHGFGSLARDEEEQGCVMKFTRKPFKSPYKEAAAIEQVSKDSERTLPDAKRAVKVGKWRTQGETANHARRILVNAKAHMGQTWANIFDSHDEDGNSSLEFPEVRAAVRNGFRVPATALADTELKALFQEIDTDSSGTLDASEFLDYISRGKRRPEDEEQLFEKRTARVKRNLNLAFRKYADSHSVAFKLMQEIDGSGDGKISEYEFIVFVRDNMMLSVWDIGTLELKSFYRAMDKNNDGVDVMELFSFIKQQQAEDASREKNTFSRKSTHESEIKQMRQKKSRSSKIEKSELSAAFLNSGRAQNPAMKLPEPRRSPLPSSAFPPGLSRTPRQ